MGRTASVRDPNHQDLTQGDAPPVPCEPSAPVSDHLTFGGAVRIAITPSPGAVRRRTAKDKYEDDIDECRPVRSGQSEAQAGLSRRL
jgi:hypothetical protein